MTLTFKYNEIKHRPQGLTFDDVLLIPQKSDIRSRRDPQLESQLTRNTSIPIPIISSNMDTVTEAPMAQAMHQFGGFGILHRFMPIEEQCRQVAQLKSDGVTPLGASIGVNGDFHERAHALVKAGVSILTIDIAHGHSIAMVETIQWLKDQFPSVEVIAGNIASPEGTEDLINAGADAIKVGIGGGSMCTTRIITGCGVPQLTAIALCSEVARAHNVPVIADGGLRTSGDVLKAFAAGASTVMLGSMLSGTIETPGEIKKGKKQYRGMASKSAQVSWRGEVPEGMAPEGESVFVSIKGHARDVLSEVCGGVRSGMSYLNATEIQEIREKAHFIQVTPAGTMESQAHGLKTNG